MISMAIEQSPHGGAWMYSECGGFSEFLSYHISIRHVILHLQMAKMSPSFLQGECMLLVLGINVSNMLMMGCTNDKQNKKH